MKVSILLFTFLISLPIYAQERLSQEDQIRATLEAAPLDQRDSAQVLGYNKENELIVLKEGTNNLICLADDPQKDGFSAACYQRDLEPFMKRGRELRKEGMDFQQVFKEREKEAIDGTLKMPDHPASLQVLSGEDGYFDPDTGKVINASLRWVVYVPFATEASLGLPLSPPAQGAPWLMFPGTHAAHIMITPPK